MDAPATPPLPVSFSPVPRRDNRHDGWTEDRQRGFIAALEETGSITAAARAVGMSTEGAYQLRRHPQAAKFRAAWEAALAGGIRRLEDTALDRALYGAEVPVYSYGKLVGTRTVYNDRLIMFMLRNRAPDRFAESAGATSPLRLAQLKQQWRKEWEEEKARESAKNSAGIIASIEAKIAIIRERRMPGISDHTHHYRALADYSEARDKAVGYRRGRTPEPEWIEPSPRLLACYRGDAPEELSIGYDAPVPTEAELDAMYAALADARGDAAEDEEESVEDEAPAEMAPEAGAAALNEAAADGESDGTQWPRADGPQPLDWPRVWRV